MLRYHLTDEEYAVSFREVNNSFHPGKDVAYVRKIIESKTSDSRVDFIVVLVGTNNIPMRRYGSRDFKIDYSELISPLTSKFTNADILCCMILPRRDDRSSDFIFKLPIFNTCIKMVLQENEHVKVIDTHCNFNVNKHLCNDNIHLSYAGQRILRQHVKNAIHSFVPRTFTPAPLDGPLSLSSSSSSSVSCPPVDLEHAAGLPPALRGEVRYYPGVLDTDTHLPALTSALEMCGSI